MAKKQRPQRSYAPKNPTKPNPFVKEFDPNSLDTIPDTYQALIDFIESLEEGTAVSPFPLRRETFARIEKITGVPLICYVTKTSRVPKDVPNHIEDDDLQGFSDLINTTPGDAVDLFLISNGGSPEATERIVNLLRGNYSRLRIIVPANAYSAATLICLSADEIIMTPSSTLGPIDPQLNGVPTRSILRAFEQVKDQLKKEGPSALTAYMPLISKYDLHILEICKSAEALAEELARTWLSEYMLKSANDESKVDEIVKFLANYDLHKSHARSISRTKARDLGLSVLNVEEIDGLAPLVSSLYHQYALWFDKTNFFKMFENARGINWGRQSKNMLVQLPQGTRSPGRTA